MSVCTCVHMWEGRAGIEVWPWAGVQAKGIRLPYSYSSSLNRSVTTTTLLVTWGHTAILLVSRGHRVIPTRSMCIVSHLSLPVLPKTPSLTHGDFHLTLSALTAQVMAIPLLFNQCI